MVLTEDHTFATSSTRTIRRKGAHRRTKGADMDKARQRQRSSTALQEITVHVPDELPALTPRLARALLAIVVELSDAKKKQQQHGAEKSP
jgi:hypothetical protein